MLALEVSRLARNNADWYRLLDLAGMTDTLIADADGIYHPALFNDRLLLGLKGTMSEAELHVLRARLDGGIRNKAARGELRRGLPVGLVWGEDDGEIRCIPTRPSPASSPRSSSGSPICGSVRGVWLWLRDQGPAVAAAAGRLPRGAEITWVEPTYHAVHNVLTHPAYAGAYVFGKTRQQRYVDEDGQLRTRRRRLPQGEWEVLITDHHRGFIDWDTYQANQARIGANTRPRPHQPGTGAVREGCALLQGLATCGTCGRKLAVYYDGPAKSTPGYYCTGTGQLVDGRGSPAPARRRRRRSTPPSPRRSWPRSRRPALQACLAAAEQLEAGHDAALAQWRRAGRTGPLRGRQSRAPLPGRRPRQPARRPRPGDRVGTPRCSSVADAEAELARREQRAPANPDRRRSSAAIAGPRRRPRRSVVGADHHRPGPQAAAAHPARRSQHQRAPRPQPTAAAELLLRWKGGAITELTVPLKRQPPEHPHRRGHHRPAAPPGRPLPRRHDRRDPQPARPPHRPGTVVHRQ